MWHAGGHRWAMRARASETRVSANSPRQLGQVRPPRVSMPRSVADTRHSALGSCAPCRVTTPRSVAGCGVKWLWGGGEKMKEEQVVSSRVGGEVGSQGTGTACTDGLNIDEAYTGEHYADEHAEAAPTRDGQPRAAEPRAAHGVRRAHLAQLVPRSRPAACLRPAPSAPYVSRPIVSCVSSSCLLPVSRSIVT